MTQRSETKRRFFLDLSARAKLRVTGADRFRFLNGQITNDLRKANETVAIEACVLNAKGKVNAHIFIAALAESFLIDAELELRETMRARLERYVIADGVQIEDVTDEFSLFHVLTEEPPAHGSGRQSRIPVLPQALSRNQAAAIVGIMWLDERRRPVALIAPGIAFPPTRIPAADLLEGP